MWNCLNSEKLCLREIDIFHITWEWLRQDAAMGEHAPALMRLIRFPLISPADLEHHVKKVDLMMSDPELCKMVRDALDYHKVPHSQPLLTSPSNHLRSYVTCLVSVGGYDIRQNPHQHDGSPDLFAKTTSNSFLNRKVLRALPSTRCHMQAVVFNNFLYVLGGYHTFGRDEHLAMKTVLRYDPRFNSWFQVRPMMNERASFFAGALNNKIYAVGGKFQNGSLATAECYDPATNTWDLIASMPMSYHAHAGAVYGNYIYISGGRSSNRFTRNMQRYDPVTNRWENMAAMLTPRGWHVMCATHDKLFVFGGRNLSNLNPSDTPSDYYDPSTDQWTRIAPLPVSYKEASCVEHNNNIYVLGGYQEDHSLLFKYDTNRDDWEAVGTMPPNLKGVGFCTMEMPHHNK